jgi:Methyltransferase domain
MIAIENLPRICELAARAERVLDVGAGWHPFNLATHVLDLMPYEDRHAHETIDVANAPRFSAATWTVHDACRAPWPFPDKFFDFSFCSHTLEDVTDPFTVCAELVRVAKAGYIETPSRAVEIFSKPRWYWLRAALGRKPIAGCAHHHWFVEIEGNHVRFRPKDAALMTRDAIITRRDLGRKMTGPESAAFLFWDGGFSFERAAAAPDELHRFRDETLRALRLGQTATAKPSAA